MLRSLILSFAFALNFIGKPVLGELAVVYGDVKLTARENCTGKLTTSDNTVTVARRVNNGTWKPVDKRYIGRIVHDSPSSLILTNLTIKDSGLFEFFCGDKHVIPGNDLKVLVAYNATVTEGDTAVISCYSSTDKQVKWFKQGGKIRVRDAFLQEVVSKEDEASPGRFPLTLEKVRLEDEGVYFCKPSMTSMAIKLMVNPRSNQTTSPPPHHPSTTPSPNEGNEKGLRDIIIWVFVAVICVLVIVVIILAIFLYLEKKKGRKSNEPPKLGEKKGETNGLLGPNNNTGSHDNNHINMDVF